MADLNLLGRKIANLALAVGFGTLLMEIIPEMESNNCFFLVVHGLLNQAKEQRKLQAHKPAMLITVLALVGISLFMYVQSNMITAIKTICEKECIS